MTTSNNEFNLCLVESLNETISSLLSEDVLEAFRSNLKNKRSIHPEEIPENLPTVSIVLEKYFGMSARTIEATTARRLYAKCGIDFQKNISYQLEDYVEAAKNKLKSTTAKSIAPKAELPGGTLPLKEDFDMLFVESVKEGIEEALGRDAAKLAFRFLEREVPFDKLPRHLPVFYAALNKNFGEGHGKIELAIARKLFHKLSLEFTETPGMDLARYVERALDKLTEREEQGFSNLRLFSII
ncbi:MAG: hypothetical protein ABSC50_02095 [Candidatus Bathyarchaeia archaeon]